MSVTNEIGRGPVLDHVRTNRSGAAIRGVLWSVVNSFAPAALGILVFMATSRVLSPAEFGIVSYAASIAMLGTAIAPAGFSEAIIQRSKIEPRHLDTVFWLCTGAALLIYAGLCFAAFPLANQLNEPILTALLPFIGIRVVFDMAAAVPNALLVRSMSFKKLAMRTTVASVVAALLCLALLWLGFGLWALAFSQLATAITTCIGALVSVRWLPKFRFSFQALRELASFGLFASGNRIITLVSIDQLLIGTLLGPAGLGIYSFARRIFQILTDLITGALSSVSYALLSSLQNERDKLRVLPRLHGAGADCRRFRAAGLWAQLGGGGSGRAGLLPAGSDHQHRRAAILAGQEPGPGGSVVLLPDRQTGHDGALCRAVLQMGRQRADAGTRYPELHHVAALGAHGHPYPAGIGLGLFGNLRHARAGDSINDRRRTFREARIGRCRPGATAGRDSGRVRGSVWRRNPGTGPQAVVGRQGYGAEEARDEGLGRLDRPNHSVIPAQAGIHAEDHPE
jgi:hypothetical protein